jgi:hypothetical protein
MVVRALNESNTLLIPFIVDPFGGLGPIANCFLFGLRPNPAPNPLHFHSATSQEAYNNTMSPAAPTGLSHRANQYWVRNLPHLPFGNTYHSWFPTNWIRQTLGANINLTFAQHLYCSIHKNYTPRLRQTQPNPYPNTIGHSTMIHQRAGNSEMGVPKNFENFHYKIVTMKTVSCVDIGAPFSLLFFKFQNVTKYETCFWRCDCCLIAIMLKFKVNAKLYIFIADSKYYLLLFAAITVAMAESMLLP